jgi:hypothetical protein
VINAAVSTAGWPIEDWKVQLDLAGDPVTLPVWD